MNCHSKRGSKAAAKALGGHQNFKVLQFPIKNGGEKKLTLAGTRKQKQGYFP